MATTEPYTPLEGGCTCRTIRYRIEVTPLIIHGCHCTYCQRETGSAFAQNALIESSLLTRLTSTPPLLVLTPSESGRGQTIARCPKCFVAVWSHYPGGETIVSFVRVGTLDQPNDFQPNIHIYTSTKRDWIVLPEGVPAVKEFYDLKAYWSEGSWSRMEKMRPLIEDEKKKKAEEVAKQCSS